MKSPYNYDIDERYGKIAESMYTQEQLEEMGGVSSSDKYYLLESGRPSCLNFVFKKNESGLLELTQENKKVIMSILHGITETKERSRDEDDEETYFFQRYENERRRIEKERGLKPGSLIHRINIYNNL